MLEVSSQRTSDARIGAEIAGLISVLGREDFPKRLFAAAQRIARCQTVTSFCFDRSRAPRLLMAENTGDLPTARRVAAKYIAEYWRYDPASHVSLGGESNSHCKAVVISANDIAPTSYRTDCYTAVDLDARMTIIGRTNEGVLRINFYRGRDSGGYDDGLAAMAAAGEMLIALLARHDTWSESARPARDISYIDRLRHVRPDLPKRELQVCALIALGLSSEGIALELGLSINTVLTLRRRAYARLRISSQNELMRLLLS